MKGISGIEFIPTSDETAPWFIDIYLERPKELMEFLKEHHIGSRMIYPPINRQKIYADGLSYSISEMYCSRGLWLPSSSFLKDEQVISICELIKTFLS